MEEYYEQKLLRMPEQFNDCMERKLYHSAKYVYDTALRVVEFMDAPQELRDRLFGNRQDGDLQKEGMFREELVQKAYEECAVKGNMGYENMLYRRPGESIRYRNK